MKNLFLILSTSSLIAQLAIAGEPPIFSLLRQDRLNELQEELLIYPQQINELTHAEENILHVLARRDDGDETRILNLAQWLIAQGAERFALNRFDQTPYDVAFANDNPLLAAIFLQIEPVQHYDAEVDVNRNYPDTQDSFFRPDFGGGSGISHAFGIGFLPLAAPSDSNDELEKEDLDAAQALAGLHNSYGQSAEDHKVSRKQLKRKRSKQKEDEEDQDSDQDFDEKRPSNARDPFGRQYKKARAAPRNPNPPPTGFQKTKDQLTYSSGPKSSLNQPEESKQARRERARKD